MLFISIATLYISLARLQKWILLWNLTTLYNLIATLFFTIANLNFIAATEYFWIQNWIYLTIATVYFSCTFIYLICNNLLQYMLNLRIANLHSCNYLSQKSNFIYNYHNITTLNVSVRSHNCNFLYLHNNSTSLIFNIKSNKCIFKLYISLYIFISHYCSFHFFTVIYNFLSYCTLYFLLWSRKRLSLARFVVKHAMIFSMHIALFCNSCKAGNDERII